MSSVRPEALLEYVYEAHKSPVLSLICIRDQIQAYHLKQDRERFYKPTSDCSFLQYSINLAYDSIIVDGEPSLLNKNINSLKKLG